MILLIDNYDSFSYNLYQYLGELAQEIKVIRNDAMTVGEIEALAPTHIILSPGPGRPEDAGVIIETVQKLGGKIPILGVCLGHQAICAAYGAPIIHAKQLMHGKQSEVTVQRDCPLFRGLPERVKVARYHSLAADETAMPDCLRITAQTDDGEIMAVQHKTFPVYGVQFHPESILTPDGRQMLRNFLAGTNGTVSNDFNSTPNTHSKDRANAEINSNNTAGSAPKEETGMIADAIKKIVDKKDLSYEEAYSVMNEIMSGETTPTQNAAFLAALSTKSTKAETIDEITGCAAAMREHALHVDHNYDVLEIVGTGGDNANSFNISTTSAIVAAAGGAKVAKHGNRAASSNCGAADCLEALGVNIQQEPEKAAAMLGEVGMCFCFAQKYHTSMKYVGAIRRELGVRTVFNILGPLTNPANAKRTVIGVYDASLVEPIAQVLIRLGVQRGMVVYGLDRLDEISLSADTLICEFREGDYKTYTVSPEDFGFERCEKSELTGGTPAENAAITRAILSGEEQGAKRNAVLLNAGAALFIAGKAMNMREGVKLAAELIDSGKAMQQLEAFAAASNR
ncbi:MAG: bifunctional anthranilate synthase component II/anthranilate phosphoribosyltransferase [Oscillospiraceae bacterium]|nr:bifunctional anthranilate synthase component II/anthranilate phosphoribosyltransferase [Oscillospiraceae bacterium]